MLPTFRNNLLVFLLLFSGILYGQQFEIQSATPQEGKVYVNFKIIKKYENERYLIKLYSSHDNYSKPLQHVTGDIDIGQEVKSTDQMLQVVWDAARELKKYQGNIQLELRGEVSYIPLHTDQSIKAKQSKETTLSWDGGNPQDQVRIELVKSGNVIKSLGQVSNSGRYTWQVEQGEKGSGYAIRLVNINNNGETYETDPFKISGKGNLLFVLTPIALLAGGGTYFLLQGIGEPGDTSNEGDIKAYPPKP